ALLTDEVFDTGGNAVAADPNLTGFTVDISGSPPTPFRVEAETFQIVSGFQVKSNGHASGNQYLQASGQEEQRASYTFTGSDGIYDLGLGYFDEADGQSQMSIFVNGVEIDNFIWNADAGNNFVNSSSFVERTISDVSLSNGDVIEIAGFQDSGEPLRTD
ncbi:hypothetical protein, partial [Ruegeria sp. SCP11]|uniref:hypothetical protein n=1 Tax=Ruegeria sp. SCP11 TaxID=3141378 RepID=UPI00333A4C14